MNLSLPASRVPTLTPRETQVFIGLASGFPYKQVAESLGIARKTMETYRDSAVKRLGICGQSNSAILTLIAIKAGLGDLLFKQHDDHEAH